MLYGVFPGLRKASEMRMHGAITARHGTTNRRNGGGLIQGEASADGRLRKRGEEGAQTSRYSEGARLNEHLHSLNGVLTVGTSVSASKSSGALDRGFNGSQSAATVNDRIVTSSACPTKRRRWVHVELNRVVRRVQEDGNELVGQEPLWCAAVDLERPAGAGACRKHHE
jgi:hypothetical protein